MMSETIQEAKNGDVRAFAQIVRQYRQSVFRICVRSHIRVRHTFQHCYLAGGDRLPSVLRRAAQAQEAVEVRAGGSQATRWRLRPGSGKRCGRKRPGNAVPESDFGLGSDAEDRIRACRDRGASV